MSMEKPRDERLVSRVFAAPRSQSWAKTRHGISISASKEKPTVVSGYAREVKNGFVTFSLD